MPAPIRALIIDDSAYNRVTLSRILDSSDLIEVVGTAVNGEDGIKQVLRHRPDVVTLDLEMPVMDGFAFLRWIMANQPTAVIAVSSKSSDRSVFKALELGAVDFISKPGGRVSPRLQEIEQDLLQKVLQVGNLRLDNLQRRVVEDQARAVPAVIPGEDCLGGIDLVAIGSSTGGPPALQYLFETLPLLPVPFAIAQHMPPTFTRLFAERVNKLTPYEVREARDGETMISGHVYMAPGGMQMEIARISDVLQIRIHDAEDHDLHAPSVDRLFESASQVCGDRVLAVILTGMGDDGSRGLRKIRERGGRTVAESEESAIIYGMPGAAVKTGCVQEILHLRQIPSAIQRLCTGNEAMRGS